MEGFFAMNDNELRKVILQKYYESREGGGFIPVSKGNFGDDISLETAQRISQQLYELKLIDLKAQYADNKIIGAWGKINANGIDAVEMGNRNNRRGNKTEPKVFISYQTTQKEYAGQYKKLFGEAGIEAFLAHEDIAVSDEWRDKILEELEEMDIFVCFLSKEYYQSHWCTQEAGIAAFRDVTIIPISLDGSIPQGFISKYQSVKLRNFPVSYSELIPGLIKYDAELGTNVGISALALAKSFRAAESILESLYPYLGELENTVASNLMVAILKNSQVHHAELCARKFIPPLLEKYGQHLERKDYDFLSDVCKEYVDNHHHK